MSDGGVESALTVCRDLAPQIASELSRQSGASVSRTSRKFRNPANVPEFWQVAVLETFDRSDTDTDTDTDTNTGEYFDQESGRFRYMKAIRINAVCVSCHGTTLAPSVESLLDREYPHDRARGYQVGELRGAFSVSWPVPEAKTP